MYIHVYILTLKKGDIQSTLMEIETAELELNDLKKELETLKSTQDNQKLAKIKIAQRRQMSPKKKTLKQKIKSPVNNNDTSSPPKPTGKPTGRTIKIKTGARVSYDHKKKPHRARQNNRIQIENVSKPNETQLNQQNSHSYNKHHHYENHNAIGKNSRIKLQPLSRSRSPVNNMFFSLFLNLYIYHIYTCIYIAITS